MTSGDFSGLIGLTSLNLYGNQLSSLPAGIFEGLTSLTTIRLGRNVADPLPLTVSLEKVAEGQFKAVAPAGALFDIVLPVSVTNGSIIGGTTTLTIPHGSLASGDLTVTRTPGTSEVVTVDIGRLPSLPRNHYGYALTKSDDLPLTVISGINTAPVFSGGATVTRSVAENTAAAVNIGTPIAATDTQNNTLTYTLSGTDASAFDIDSSTGQLKTKASLDYETKTSYMVTITVSDGSLTDTITVTINVTDIDEVVSVVPPTTSDSPPANTAPEFLEGGITTLVVAENTPAGTNIGSPISATDSPGDLLVYTLGGIDSDSFDIESGGQLKTKASLDYETKRIYSVTITVEDEALSDTITVIISVIDVNDTVMSVGFVPVADRTPQVRDAIVAAVPNVTDAADVTESQVAAITVLNLRNQGISSLITGDFSGMTSLTNLNLFRNQLSSLPAGIFNGLTALSTLRLGGNAVDPMPIIVSLQQVSDSAFIAIITTGAPFDIVLPITVKSGSISDRTTSVTIPKGSAESASFTVTGASTKVSFGTLPSLPTNHFGYMLSQSNVCNRTPEVAEAIAKAVGVSDCSDVTETDLATITTLDLSDQSITSLSLGDFDGMLSLKYLLLAENDLRSLPSGIYDDLVSLSSLFLGENRLTSLPSGIFGNLTSLTHLYLQGNDLSSLPSNAFDGLSSLGSINLEDNELTSLPGGIFDGMPYLNSILLSNNKLTSIPNGVFEDLTQLRQLHVGWNPNPNSELSLTVSLQKFGTNQVKAVAPTGAPFAIVLPITITNGRIGNGATTITIPIGKVESQPFTVTRSAGTTDAVTANIGTLPTIPLLHNGYGLVKGTDLPIEVIPPLNSPPVFTDGAATTLTVAENTASGENIGAVITATDVDGDTLTYSLGGTDATAFGINTSSGQLKTITTLDYETKSIYTLIITASDGDLTDTIAVTINITDVEEQVNITDVEEEVIETPMNNPPVFTEGSTTTRTVFEGTLSGVDIGSAVAATDEDGHSLIYSLGGTDADSFSIDTTIGQLRTNAPLDFETKSSYSVTITVSDGIGAATIAVTINVSNATENSAPVFTGGTNVIRSIAENTGSGVDIGSPVSATDVDNDTLTYSLGGTEASSFSIDSTTGQLRTNAPLDYESDSSYTVTLTVSDGNGGIDSITVTINITDVDETPSNSSPIFDEGSSTSRSVQENTSSGVDIGSAVSATDDDGDDLSYSLGGTDAALFSIDASTGQLSTSSSLNYETEDSYSVTITASDGSLVDSIDVTIDIIDVNDAPVFTVGSSTSRIFAEDAAIGVNVGAPVIATDDDGDNLSYSLSGTDAAAFSIDNTSGQLKTAVAFNAATKTAYSVIVTVYDGNLSDTITVTINIRSVNDAPVFKEGNSATRSIAENTVSNINIGAAVSATDADNDSLTYTLGGTDAAAFGIIATNGQLRTNAALNFETKETYSVVITASDGTLSDTITVTINITNANDVPVFTDGATTTRSIAENTAAGINIGTAIVATDEDKDTLTYALGGTDTAAFDIIATNGQLQTKASLDYEDKDEYTVTVAVADGNGGTDAISVTINVTDLTETLVNNPPVFTDGISTTRSIVENSAADVNIGAPIAATDADNNTLAYTLSGTDAALFAIDSSIGQLKTNAALDHEVKAEYGVIVNVNDGSTSVSISVTINVTDANDAPEFTVTSATRSIAENTVSGQNIGSAITATDQDGDDLTYTLGGTDSASFSIVSTSGQLQSNAALNYENKSSYTVTITASDGTATDRIDVTITITDANDAPTFSDGVTTTRSVVENTVSGQNIGSAITATDPDSGDILTYTLGGTDAASFSIVSTSGQLQTNVALDYETKTSYTVRVSVSDDNGGTDSITVTINVTDINENRAPVFTDGTNTTRSIAENTASGQNIGSAVAATDPNIGDTLTYTLGGTDAGSFDIVSTSGQLQTKAALDYESKTSYTVAVSVSDGNGGSDSISVTVNVTDVDENRAPTFTEGVSTTRSVAENTGSGVDIGTAVSATDPDDDTLSYTLGGTDASSFSINSTTGQLRTSAALDYETKRSYSVTITVSDGNGKIDTITVTVNVTDVQENRSPVFSEGDSTTRAVAENTTSGVNIGSAVSATDADTDDTLTYTLGGTDASSFSINSTTGQLRTSAALNYESKSSYSLTVSVSDGNGGSDSITVTINITDANDAPVFSEGSSAMRSIAENTASGVNIGSVVAATDSDTVDTLTYILGGTDAASFSIVSTTGQLQTKAALDYETKTSYTVTVSVSDGNGGSDSISVTITVTDVSGDSAAVSGDSAPVSGNSAPVFTDGTSTTRDVSENTASGQNIGTAVGATDSDIDDTLTYTLGGTDAASFSIVSTSGQLQTKAALDYETKTSYAVTVSVSDGNGGSDSITVTINITDANDAPVFSEGSSAMRSIAENTASGVNIGSVVAATDDDIDDTLTYTLGGTNASSFSIVSTTGQLQAKAPLVFDGTTGQLLSTHTYNYEGKSSYSLTVSVSDGNGGSDSIAVTINITDVNEPPVFRKDGSSAIRTVFENTKSGQNLGSPVAAIDSDIGDKLTYTLGGPDAASFSIVSTSGQLQTKVVPFDYDNKPSYSVTVSVSDGSHTVSITVTINVLVYNVVPVFTDGTSTTRDVSENTASGQNIGTAVRATDLDIGDTLTYTLGGTDAASFSIVSTSGQLQTKAALDYETKTSYSVMVSVSDGRGGSDSITVTIDVTDVSDSYLLYGRTPQIQEAIVAAVDGVDAAADVTAEHLAAITTLSFINYSPVTPTSHYISSLVSVKSGDFAGLTALTSLDLRPRNGMNSLPSDVFSELTNLETLRIAFTGTSWPDDGVFDNLTNLNRLELFIVPPLPFVDSLSSLPDGIFDNLTNLTILTVTNNHLKSLSSDVFDNLTNLKSLNLQTNSFTTLPSGIFDELTNLTSLSLAYNKLTTLPSDIFDELTNLTTLSLDYNALTTLPSDIFDELTNLKILYMKGALSMSSLPSGIFDELTNLTTLELIGNELTTLPSGIFDELTNLTSLSLAYNKLTTLPSDIFDELTDLKMLFMRDALSMSSLPSGIFDELTNLTTLDLGEHVLLCSLPSDIFDKLTILTTLDMSQGCFKDISEVEGLTSLTHLYVSGNPFSDYKPLRRLIAAIEADGRTLTLDITIPSVGDNNAPIFVETSPELPKTTALLSNYPNPFNPETWIPYQLAKASEVTITIYNMRGVVVRELKLGHKAPGIYTTRKRAIHWDGRNAIGEKVATGVYFYTLKTGDYTATRKMLIRK